MKLLDPNDRLAKVINEYPLVFICFIFFFAMIIDSL